MPRKAAGLTALKVAKAKPGRYGDGGGLYLLVRSPTAKFWSFRYVRSGKMREIGLGPATGPGAVSLADARRAARDLHDQHREGRDPLAERNSERAKRALERGGRTFAQAADSYFEAHQKSWRHPLHVKQWAQCLRDYILPALGPMLVGEIETRHVAEILQPIWTTKTETATRVRSRIELVLGREKALGHRRGENPARWRENLDAVLPKRSKVATVKHYAAMPANEVGEFMTRLRADSGTVARALELCILTTTRTTETLGARWHEVNFNERIWTIPKERMKAGREHRVPLSSRAIKILQEMQRHRSGEFIFAGRSGGDSRLTQMVLLDCLRRMGVPYTTHGFRSTFKDWTSDSTNFSSEVAELALAHAVSDKVEAAYRRGDALQKRFALAEAWGKFCARRSIKGSAKIVNIGSRATAP